MSGSHTHTHTHTARTGGPENGPAGLRGAGRGLQGGCPALGRTQPVLPSTLRSQGPPASSVLLQASASLAVTWVTVRVNYTCVSVM